MIPILIAFFILIWITVWVYRQDAASGLAVFVFGLVIGFFLLVALFSIIKSVYDTVPYVAERKDIVLMKDGSDINGRFSLFGGYIDQEQVFNYYTSKGGAKKLEHIAADKAVIFEDAEVNPYLEVICDKKDMEFGLTLWYLVPYNSCDKYWDGRYEFHIPAGSITNEIKLDGE